MKAVALISHNDSIKSKWQFDRVMAAIAYDIDLSIVFICEGCQQMDSNVAWKCLPLYDVKNVYFHNVQGCQTSNPLFDVKPITTIQLQQLIQEAQFIL